LVYPDPAALPDLIFYCPVPQETAESRHPDVWFLYFAAILFLAVVMILLAHDMSR
jgi:hypothetical protein